MQKVVLSKYEKGEYPKKIFDDLCGVVSLRTIERWCKSIRETGEINLQRSTGRPRIIRTNATIQKVRKKTNKKPQLSARKMALEMGLSETTVRRVLKDDLKLKAYKKTVQPLLTDEHKEKRKRFANWIRTNFRKEDTMRILFSDEKLFDSDGIYNSQNERIWAATRTDADAKNGIRQTRKFPMKVMVWLAVCSKGVSPLIVFEKGTVDHNRYIREVLPVALQYSNATFGGHWTFQQDGATPHTHKETQAWCAKHFPSFIDKEHWPPNSPDMNPLDYSIWDEFASHIQWNKIKTKKDLVNEVKRAVNDI